MSLKENVEKLSNERTLCSLEFKKANDTRAHKFLEFFDSVAKQVEFIYQSLTLKDSTLNQAGRAALFLEDRQNPFERNIHFTPQPPGKRVIYDVN